MHMGPQQHQYQNHMGMVPGRHGNQIAGEALMGTRATCMGVEPGRRGNQIAGEALMGTRATCMGVVPGRHGNQITRGALMGTTATCMGVVPGRHQGALVGTRSTYLTWESDCWGPLMGARTTWGWCQVGMGI
jgi:hypothetical protein